MRTYVPSVHVKKPYSECILGEIIMAQPQSFFITNILSTTQIVISGGSDNGVNIGDQFNILEEEPREITNPDNGDVLHSFWGFKAKLQVTEVHYKYSILTSMPDMDPVDNYDMNTLGQFDVTPQPLNVNESDIDNIFSTYSDETIYIGDIVIKEN